MPIVYQGLIAGKMSSTRYIPSRSGYTGAPIPQAIVLHQLRGISCDAYADQLCSPLPRFLCTPDPITCTFPNETNPRGVHFIVTNQWYKQFAELSDITLGLDYINGNWPPLTALMPITDVNGPFIHIAVCGPCDDRLITLLCCLGVSLNRSLPILSAGDLQTDRPLLILNPQLQTQVDNCIASGGFVNPPTVQELADEIVALQACCTANTSAIIALEATDIIQNNRLLALEDDVTTIKSQIVDIYTKIAIIPSLQAQIITLVNQVTDILTRCCPKKVDNVCFQYQLTPGNEMIITANQPVWLNLPTKVEDRDNPNCVTGCCGPIVQPGPLWMADLSCSDCNSCATWNINATVRFRLANWCAGKKASMYLVACGSKYLLAEETISMTGPQAVTLSGSFLLPCGCTDVHLLIAHSDDKITTAHTIDFGNIKGCCA